MEEKYEESGHGICMFLIEVYESLNMSLRLSQVEYRNLGIQKSENRNASTPPLLVNGRGALPYPFESAGAANFDFGQWFTRIIFPCDFLDSFDAMFEDLILTSNISSIISPILFQVFLHK